MMRNNPDSQLPPKILSLEELERAPEGILLVDKPAKKTSFSLVAALRKKTKVKKIGHAGTLDPFATGLMILLIGKKYTVLSDTFLSDDKEYRATIHLGVETDTYDTDGHIVSTQDKIPSLEEIQNALSLFQGTIEQTPPMFSAKKVGGKKLYELARKGITIERKKSVVTVCLTLLAYTYPFLSLHVSCSKGTYIRSLAHDIGSVLQTGGHLHSLQRTRCGPFHLKEAIPGEILYAY